MEPDFQSVPTWFQQLPTMSIRSNKSKLQKMFDLFLRIGERHQSQVFNESTQLTFNFSSPYHIIQNGLISYEVSQFIIHPNYLKSSTLEQGKYFDIALLKLKTTIQLNRIERQIHCSLRKNIYSTNQILLSGYPRRYASIFNNQIFKADQYESKFIVNKLDINERLIMYINTTWGGQSGSPLMTKQIDQSFRVIGMHQGFQPDEKKNSAIRLTYDNMRCFSQCFQKWQDAKISIFLNSSFRMVRIKQKAFQCISINSHAGRRAMYELKTFQRFSLTGIAQVEVVNNNIFNWHAIIIGPEQTPYAGGVFHLNIQFTRDYPLTPPFINFMTKIYHPNINSYDGAISLDILDDNNLNSQNSKLPHINFYYQNVISLSEKKADSKTEVNIILTFMMNKNILQNIIGHLLQILEQFQSQFHHFQMIQILTIHQFLKQPRFTSIIEHNLTPQLKNGPKNMLDIHDPIKDLILNDFLQILSFYANNFSLKITSQLEKYTRALIRI